MSILKIEQMKHINTGTITTNLKDLQEMRAKEEREREIYTKIFNKMCV